MKAAGRRVVLVGMVVAAVSAGTLVSPGAAFATSSPIIETTDGDPGGQGWFDDLDPERITVQDVQDDGLAAVAELRVLQDNGEWVRRMLARDGDGGALADSDTHNVDEGQSVQFRVCLQRGEGAFNYCGRWTGRA